MDDIMTLVNLIALASSIIICFLIFFVVGDMVLRFAFLLFFSFSALLIYTLFPVAQVRGILLFIIVITEFLLFQSRVIFYRLRFKTFGREFALPLYILDCSVVLDKRVFFLIQEHIINGIILIPDFIVEDLRRLAIKDPTKEKLISESLDMVYGLIEGRKVPIDILDTAPFGIQGSCDDKILLLVRKLKGFIVTNDFDLCQRAKLFQLKPININTVANNLKIQKVPGDTVTIKIVKKGKDQNQGVGYLEDGTMVVVENGSGNIDEVRDILITSIIPTSAGRILFGRL